MERTHANLVGRGNSGVVVSGTPSGALGEWPATAVRRETDPIVITLQLAYGSQMTFVKCAPTSTTFVKRIEANQAERE